jgi:hypothetical protein
LIPASRGRRLVFSNGIVALALASIGLVVLFQVSVDRLIPLYAIGVFTSFTLSQAGMAAITSASGSPAGGRAWRSTASARSPPPWSSLVIAVTKFSHGAWMIILLVPALVAVFVRINRYSEHLQRAACDGEVAASRAACRRRWRSSYASTGSTTAPTGPCALRRPAQPARRPRSPHRQGESQPRGGLLGPVRQQLEFLPRRHGSTVRAARHCIHGLRCQARKRALAVVVPEVLDGGDGCRCCVTHRRCA